MSNTGTQRFRSSIWPCVVASVLLLGAGAGGAVAESDAEVVSGRTPDGHGGGEFAIGESADELTEEQRQFIWSRIRQNVSQLRSEGTLPADPAPRANPTLAWPLRAATTSTDYGYHGISGFVDQNPSFPNALLDYNCGARTYDVGNGYNHQGIDYFLWPFAWNKMDSAEVEIVAAAAGTIVFKQDGQFDRSCSFNSNPWNAVFVQHADDSIAWYGHMKNGSPTSKPVGAAVAQGEYLGLVGSSGNSTGPHLHLELYDSEGDLNEPYQGPCNGMNANSWWASQRPYYDSAANHLATNWAAPSFSSCPNPDSPNERNVFSPGETVYFVTYYRDQLSSQTVQYRIYRPDGTTWTSWTHNSDATHYAASYWYWWWNGFASGGPTGIWRFEVTFEGRTYTHYFSVGANAGSGRIPGQQNEPVPLTLERAGAQVVLTWADSCVTTDVDYEVYEGTLGVWYDHLPRVCSTAGATSISIAPGTRDHYYLVVPTDTINEGSFGRRSGLAAERPTGATSCLSQQIAGCP